MPKCRITGNRFMVVFLSGGMLVNLVVSSCRYYAHDSSACKHDFALHIYIYTCEYMDMYTNIDIYVDIYSHIHIQIQMHTALFSLVLLKLQRSAPGPHAPFLTRPAAEVHQRSREQCRLREAFRLFFWVERPHSGFAFQT